MEPAAPPPRDPPTYQARGPGSEPSGLSPDKLLAASVASVLAALVTSRFGAAGTLIGAALTPVIVILSSFAMETSLGRARTSTLSRQGGATSPGDTDEAGDSTPGRLWFGLTHLTRQRIVFGIAAGAIAFAMAMVAVTAFESAVGKPLSGILRDGADGGTTLAPKGENDDGPTPAPSVDGPDDQQPEAKPQGEEKSSEGPITKPPPETAPAEPEPDAKPSEPAPEQAPLTPEDLLDGAAP